MRVVGPLLRTLSFGRWRDAPLVSVIRLAGVIGPGGALRGGLNLAGLEAPLRRLFHPRHQNAVALIVNSPGGTPVQASLIAARIRALADEHETPVLAFVEDVAASGGYWLACAADEIYADACSLVGSIGVITAGFGFQDLIGRFGVERRVHTAGHRKMLLDPFRPESEDDVARLTAIQHDVHAAFKDQVRSRRGDRLTGDEATLFSGEVWTAPRALALGLIDGLGHPDAVLRARYGPKVRLRRVGLGRGWLVRRADGLLAAAEHRLIWARYGL